MSIQAYRTALLTAIAALMGVGIMAGSANADFYQFTFGGEVVELEGIIPEPWADVRIGSIFEVSYIFDSEAEDQHWHDDIGKYAIVSAEITVDGASQITSNGQIEIWLDQQLYLFKFADLPIDADGHIGLWAIQGRSRLTTYP